MRRYVSILVSLLLLAAFTVPVSAGSVTYDGGGDQFIFAPGTEEAPTNLFEEFQNVMPGDHLTEQIVIRNDSEKNVKIRVYLKSLGAQEETEAFLSRLSLTVAQGTDSPLFAAAAHETASLTDWVCLGTVYSGGVITLDVTLEVPEELGNEYQHAVGVVDWAFKVEELPVEPDDPEPPKTGDSSRPALYGALMTAALMALVLSARKLKKA